MSLVQKRLTSQVKRGWKYSIPCDMIKVTTRRINVLGRGFRLRGLSPPGLGKPTFPYDIYEGPPIRLPSNCHGWACLMLGGSNAVSKARSRRHLCKPQQSGLSKALTLTKLQHIGIIKKTQISPLHMEYTL